MEKGVPFKKTKHIAELTSNGRCLCPKCGRTLAKVYYGAYGCGIEIKCRCGTLVTVELGDRAS